MDKLLDNLFLLIPLALLLFFRVFAGNIKARAAKKSDIVPSKAKKPGLFAQLIGQLTAYAKDSTGPLGPLHFEEGTAKLDELSKARRVDAPAIKPPTVKPSAIPSKAKKKLAAFAFPAALERLPPLKKAVALSEILGTPRSLR